MSAQPITDLRNKIHLATGFMDRVRTEGARQPDLSEESLVRMSTHVRDALQLFIACTTAPNVTVTQLIKEHKALKNATQRWFTVSSHVGAPKSPRQSSIEQEIRALDKHADRICAKKEAVLNAEARTQEAQNAVGEDSVQDSLRTSRERLDDLLDNNARFRERLSAQRASRTRTAQPAAAQEPLVEPSTKSETGFIAWFKRTVARFFQYLFGRPVFGPDKHKPVGAQRDINEDDRVEHTLPGERVTSDRFNHRPADDVDSTVDSFVAFDGGQFFNGTRTDDEGEGESMGRRVTQIH